MNISDMKAAVKEAMREIEKESKGSPASLSTDILAGIKPATTKNEAASGTVTVEEEIKEEVKEISAESIPPEMKADIEPPSINNLSVGSGTVTDQQEPPAVQEEKKEVIIVLDEKSYNLIDRLNVFENKLSKLTNRVRDIENRKSFIQKIIDYFSSK